MTPTLPLSENGKIIDYARSLLRQKSLTPPPRVRLCQKPPRPSLEADVICEWQLLKISDFYDFN